MEKIRTSQKLALLWLLITVATFWTSSAFWHIFCPERCDTSHTPRPVLALKRVASALPRLRALTPVTPEDEGVSSALRRARLLPPSDHGLTTARRTFYHREMGWLNAPLTPLPSTTLSVILPTSSLPSFVCYRSSPSGRSPPQRV